MADPYTTLLTAVSRLPDLFRSARADSLVKYTKVTRVEPVTLVDAKAVHLPYTHDVLQTLNSIFAGYYLQAVAISVNVGKIDVVRLLDKVNPSRDPMENAGMFIGDILSEEAYHYALPVPGMRTGLEAYYSEEAKGGNQRGGRPTPLFGMRDANVNIDADVEINNTRTQTNTTINEARAPGTGAGFGRDTIKAASEVANLSVGKLLEVQIEQGNHKATIPVAVRLIVSSIGSENLVHILSVGSKDKSVKERYHGWRSGQLEFIKDTILCQDLIDDHRKTLMNDKSGMYQQTLDRRNKNKLSAILSAAPSVATASNLVVLTSETARQLESVSNGRLKDFKFRQNIFKDTYVMLMVVIDPAFEQITIYTRDLEQAMTVSTKEIKSANKGTGPDVAEILKAYQLGTSPSI